MPTTFRAKRNLSATALRLAVIADRGNPMTNMDPRAWPLGLLRWSLIGVLALMPATLDFSQQARGQTPSAAQGCQDLDLVLTATMISDRIKLANFGSTEEDRKPLRLQEGDVHRGWTLDVIEEDGVIFRRQGAALRLSFGFEPRCAPE